MESTDICMLLDFYGQLLTGRMRSLLELHYAEDMSLAEIAIQEDISRQAVSDTVRRGVRSLEEYESKLGLVSRFMAQKKYVKEAIEALERNDAKKAHGVLSDLMDTL